MVSTKWVGKNIPEIESKLKNYGRDMVKIEFLENCLRQILPNDVKRFCYLKLSELYNTKLMYGPAARNMELAAECATSHRDKINFYMKEVRFLIKSGDYSWIEKPYKKALAYAGDKEKETIKQFLKNELFVQADEFEKKNKRANALKVYEKALEMHDLLIETERRMVIAKVADLNSKLGKIKEAIRYEQIADKAVREEQRKIEEKNEQVKKLAENDLGIEIIDFD